MTLLDNLTLLAHNLAQKRTKPYIFHSGSADKVCVAPYVASFSGSITN